MRRDHESYKTEIVQRMPRGRCWPNLAWEGSVWDALIDALAMEPSRVDADVSNWLEDYFPDSTVQQLDRWELILGLSAYDSSGNLLADDVRRGQILARIKSRNVDPTVANLSDIAAAYLPGSYVEERLQPCFQCGVAQMGQPSASMGGNYQWQSTLWVQSSGSHDPLFESLMRQVSHAQWTLVFDYGALGPDQVYDGVDAILDGSDAVVDS